VLAGIGAWMDVNKNVSSHASVESFGEGPARKRGAFRARIQRSKGKPFTAADVRFTTKGKTLYAIVLGTPQQDLQIKSLGTAAKLLDKPIGSITLLAAARK